MKTHFPYFFNFFSNQTKFKKKKKIPNSCNLSTSPMITLNFSDSAFVKSSLSSATTKLHKSNKILFYLIKKKIRTEKIIYSVPLIIFMTARYLDRRTRRSKRLSRVDSSSPAASTRSPPSPPPPTLAFSRFTALNASSLSTTLLLVFRIVQNF